MAEPAKIPADPLAVIRACVRSGEIYWTYHVNMRLAARSINRDEIVSAVERFEVIESYPDDKYLPSYLVLAKSDDKAIHVLFAVDLEGNNVRVITGYRPDPLVWDADLRKRTTP